MSLDKRYDQGEYWWELRACDYYEEFEKPKIMLPDISLRGNFALDEEGGKYCVNTAYIIANSEPYLLGILNSSLITFFYKNIASTYRGGYLRFIYQYLMVLPIPVINFDNPSDKASHDQMVSLVDQMLALNRKLDRTRTAHEKELLLRQIQAV
ncbi:MAG: TaqI-like C-terminal specificity domain-containing protein, partial [Desulfosalsimonadaceae bacterium]